MTKDEADREAEDLIEGKAPMRLVSLRQAQLASTVRGLQLGDRYYTAGDVIEESHVADLSFWPAVGVLYVELATPAGKKVVLLPLASVAWVVPVL